MNFTHSVLTWILRTVPGSLRGKGVKMDSEKVANHWGEMARKRVEKGSAPQRCPWMDSPLIQKYYIHPTISGNGEANWLIWVKDNYFPEPAETALSIGCGDGCLERHGAIINAFKKCDAFDISPGAIEIAKTKAKELNIGERVNYEIADSNGIHLKDNYYDVVFAAMALHHIENLESLFKKIASSLKKNGLFIVNEYVGPNRFQWTDTQLQIANDLLLLLPERYRIDPVTKAVISVIHRQPLELMIAVDPSEAVRSRDIIRLMEDKFKIIERIDYGGTILHLLLNDIILNFDEDRPEDMALLHLFFYFEKLLIQRKVLESDFSLIVARKG